MKLSELFMMLLVVAVDGATVEAPSDLQCYKKTTEWDEDFTCTWKPGISGGNLRYILNYCAFNRQIMDVECKRVDAGSNHFADLINDCVDTGIETYMWLDAHLGNSTYSSANISLVLKDQVRFDAPDIESMSRSSGNLTLSWMSPPKESGMVVNEIQYRRSGERSWQNKTLETSVPAVKYTLNFRKDAVYEVRVRWRAKPLPTHIWSDWSKTKKVPTEIREQPKVKCEVGELSNGVRPLKLSWTAPSEEESVGGVKYILSHVITPCWPKNKTIQLSTTEYKGNVTASAVNVRIVAINNVGHSPEQKFTIPAQFLKNCLDDQGDKLKRNKRIKCVEWYEMTGDNSAVSVENEKAEDAGNAISQTKEGLKDFVRYHYFVHVRKRQGKGQTIAMCPIYKIEGVPKQGPPNVTVDVTDNSALVSWQPIPITQQQGFLRNYVIYITRGSDTNVVNVSQSQTKYTIENLTPGTLYIVNIAGETSKGVGPNTTREIPPNPPQGLSGMDWIIVGIIVVPVALTVFCSFIIKRLKHKLLPEIPVPTITEAQVNHIRNDEELYPAGEELHAVVLVHNLPEKISVAPAVEQSPLLEVCETTLSEDEGEETAIDSDAFELNLPLNSDYKRQTLSLPAPPESEEHDHQQAECEPDTPIYRNGLVFELKVENTQDINSQL